MITTELSAAFSKPEKVKKEKPPKTKQNVTWLIRPEDHDRLKVISAEMKMPIQEMMNSAMNDFLIQHGREPFRPLPGRGKQDDDEI